MMGTNEELVAMALINTMKTAQTNILIKPYEWN